MEWTWMGVLSLWKGLNPVNALRGIGMETMIVTVGVIVLVAMVEGQEVLVAVGSASNVESLDILLVNVHLMMEGEVVVGMVVGMTEEVEVNMELTMVGTAIVEVEVEVEVDVTENLVGIDMEVIGTTVIVLARMSDLDVVTALKVTNAMEMMFLVSTRKA